MSFLNVLSSIGGDDGLTNGPQPNSTIAKPKPKPKPSLPNIASSTDPTTATVQSPQSGIRISSFKSALPAPNGLKRKAEGISGRSGDPSRPPLKKSSPSSTSADKKVADEKATKAALRAGSKDANGSVTTGVEKKAPAPGSFAALMAEAKAAQEEKGGLHLGVIKHQATNKKRMSHVSKRQRQEDEATTKTQLGKRPLHNNKIHKPLPKIVTKRDVLSYKGTAKPATPATPVSSYKGTAGLPSRNRPTSSSGPSQKYRKASKYNEYLGTDEEDLGEANESGGTDDPASDVSSDMEAGAFDLEREESNALRVAKVDDAKEMEMENKLKQAKIERRRKLEALAKKRR